MPAVLTSLVLAACGQGSASSTTPQTSGPVTISLAVNAVVGGKNVQEASWLHDWAIPTFEQQEAKNGQKVTVDVQYIGSADEVYTRQLALDIQSKTGPDAFDLDGPYVGEFVTSGYLKPLAKVPGSAIESDWSGWHAYSRAVLQNMSFEGQLYGVPNGTDGRVLFYNKNVFQAAGLPVNWQPKSWNDIISAARQIKARDPGAIPLQINASANSSFGEATTLQGFLPFLGGAGQLIYNDKTKKWTGNTAAMRKALDFFQTIYSQGLASQSIQVNPDGRTVSFQQFAAGKIGVLLESEYLYESVLTSGGLAPMADRDTAVGWALIPSMSPGIGVNHQSYISFSGGGGRVINPYTQHSKATWDLLAFLNSAPALEKFFTYEPIITGRPDVDATLTDPLLKYIASKVLPYTYYRPSLAAYPQVSVDIQTMAQSVAEGQASPAQAAQTFASQLEGISGIGPGHVDNS